MNDYSSTAHLDLITNMNTSCGPSSSFFLAVSSTIICVYSQTTPVCMLRLAVCQKKKKMHLVTKAFRISKLFRENNEPPNHKIPRFLHLRISYLKTTEEIFSTSFCRLSSLFTNRIKQRTLSSSCLFSENHARAVSCSICSFASTCDGKRK